MSRVIERATGALPVGVGQQVGLGVYDHRLPGLVEAVEVVGGHVVVRVRLEEAL